MVQERPQACLTLSSQQALPPVLSKGLGIGSRPRPPAAVTVPHSLISVKWGVLPCTTAAGRKAAPKGPGTKRKLHSAELNRALVGPIQAKTPSMEHTLFPKTHACASLHSMPSQGAAWVPKSHAPLPGRCPALTQCQPSLKQGACACLSDRQYLQHVPWRWSQLAASLPSSPPCSTWCSSPSLPSLSNLEPPTGLPSLELEFSVLYRLSSLPAGSSPNNLQGSPEVESLGGPADTKLLAHSGWSLPPPGGTIPKRQCTTSYTRPLLAAASDRWGAHRDTGRAGSTPAGFRAHCALPWHRTSWRGVPEHMASSQG